MIFEKIKSEGLSQNSYFVGSGFEAAVIDPRRDCDIYLELAKKFEVKITRIFETHRNEDYVIGSLELSKVVGAEILHGAKLDFSYGSSVAEGDKFNVGSLEFEILETPGHTDESISITLKDKESSDSVHMVFTGDTLFSGDVGRTDLYGESEKPRLAENMYNSLFNKILPLGNEVIVSPAHGAGSVCGGDIAGFEYTTIGFEKKNNRALKNTDKDSFVAYKLNERLEKPSYFTKMEVYNRSGPPLLHRLPTPDALPVKEIKEHIKDGAQVVDTRMPTAYSAGHIPGSTNIWKDGLPIFAGWMLNYEKPILIVKENDQSIDEIVRYLIRLGYDRIAGYLSKGFPTWYKAAERIGKIEEWTVRELEEHKDDESIYILDVRDDRSWKEDGFVGGANHVYVGHLREQLREVPKSKRICVFCDSGFKTGIASSILKTNGYENVVSVLGGMTAWKKSGYKVEKE
jgi:hydroxyacylglutathione hydrolase